jgi:hypothetical protein
LYFYIKYKLKFIYGVNSQKYNWCWYLLRCGPVKLDQKCAIELPCFEERERGREGERERGREGERERGRKENIYIRSNFALFFSV